MIYGLALWELLKWNKKTAIRKLGAPQKTLPLLPWWFLCQPK
jgi:hypothetical protein